MAVPPAYGARTFDAPEGWSRTATRWDGDCVGGLANVLGVLKGFEGRQVERLFFGTMAGGELEFGVFDGPEGYMAGKFSKGSPVPSDDCPTYVSAFAEGEKAADLAAGRYRRSGNQGSAKFYEGKAKALREQMD